jgi:hypothetical protein
MTRWRSGPQGYYDDYGLGLGRYPFESAQVIGHHGVWGAFAFWCPELDATITGTVNTAKVDRRPLLRKVVLAVTTHHDGRRRRHRKIAYGLLNGRRGPSCQPDDVNGA